METRRAVTMDMDSAQFREIGHQLVDKIADFINAIREKPVTTGESPGQLQALLGTGSLPENGRDISDIISQATDFLFEHSLFNGHPKFSGYITSSPAPIGALADLLASTVNPNVGANILSPAATEIEKQTIKWLSDFIGVPGYGGLLVSGGNMANFTAFLAARTAKAPKHIKEDGISNNLQKLVVYCSKATHTWIEKAVVLFGLGTNAIRWIETDERNMMDTANLQQAIEKDISNGYMPLMVVGNAGDVSTGVVDDLRTLGVIAKKYDTWFHVDGAYGIPAAVVPALQYLFNGINQADSIALDPHKWLYSPLEAGCTLVKDPNHLIDTFSSHPVYYNFSSEEPSTVNYYEYGLQNSRGFRALKVWMALQQAGRNGYIQMIAEDCRLSGLMFELATDHPELEAVTQNLSIATFRYIPHGYDAHNEKDLPYLNNLNEKLLNALQHGGKVFMSNALVKDKYCLRSCIVNFRTTERDIYEIMDIVVEEGRKLHKQLSMASSQPNGK